MSDIPRNIPRSFRPNFTGVSCGIPDFRSRDGLYASLKNKGEYALDDPQQMYEIVFKRQIITSLQRR
jgi:NAD-dependent SIR2 family protein deacetylase